MILEVKVQEAPALGYYATVVTRALLITVAAREVSETDDQYGEV